MKALVVIEFNDEWFDRLGLAYDELFADVIVYRKESLRYQCDYEERIYRCWAPLKEFDEVIGDNND